MKFLRALGILTTTYRKGPARSRAHVIDAAGCFPIFKYQKRTGLFCPTCVVVVRVHRPATTGADIPQNVTPPQLSPSIHVTWMNDIPKPPLSLTAFAASFALEHKHVTLARFVGAHHLPHRPDTPTLRPAIPATGNPHASRTDSVLHVGGRVVFRRCRQGVGCQIPQQYPIEEP